MKESRSTLYPVLTGLAGGALAWCGSEWLLRISGSFPDLRTFSIVFGGAAGLLLGAIAPTAEGFRQAQKHKVINSVIVGSIIGAVAGSLGMLVGQVLMALIVDTTGSGAGNWNGALSRIPGWVIMGMAIGAASGIRSGSLRRIGAGLVGGGLGGLLGGAIAESAGAFSGGLPGRAAGMIIWGIAVAWLADVMEARRSSGRLTVLSGPLKGRSFPVNQHNMTIAVGRKDDLTIPGDASDSAESGVTRLSLRKGTVVLQAADGESLQVNGENTEKTELRYDDVIKVGGTTVIYEVRR